MKRVFKIGEVVWYSEDHECGWGKVGLINRSDEFPEYNCSDEGGDILTIEKECGGEIECSPSNVYQVAQNRFFRGEPVVWDHNEEIDYPFYCPAEDENCYYCELEEHPTTPRGFFEITSVSKDDLDAAGFDTEDVDDGTMETIARKMSDAYLENGFWEDLKVIADYLGLKKRR